MRGFDTRSHETLAIRAGRGIVRDMNKTNNTVTADTITTAQIDALHDEAVAAGDTRQAVICQIATAANETANEEGADLVGPDGEIWTRTEAREACADAINAARAMEVA